MLATGHNIDHIVIVMMENRSFDHMLGYLALPQWRLGSPGDPGSMVEGVDPERAVFWQGEAYQPRPLTSSLWKGKDFGNPPHDGASVARQVADPAQYLATYHEWHGGADPRVILDYLTRDHVPVYDFFARNYCVCDHWFCSVPGATWPNRMFAVAGTAGDETDNVQTLIEGLRGKKTVFRHLDRLKVDWRWYSSDPSLLRVFDPHYRVDNSRDRFAFFDEWTKRQRRSFLTDVQHGTLPEVSWVDPNFFKLPGSLDTELGANDDHPPQDVMDGQHFINVVYEALRRSGKLKRTLLIVTYDEHGGFYDHVQPDGPYGPRVPAFVISPYVAPGRPCHDPLEHTSIIKTILERFGDDQAIEEMGPRVSQATSVWHLLAETSPRDCEPVTDPGKAAVDPAQDLVARELEWPGATIQRTIQVIDDYAGKLSDLQDELIQIYAHLRGAVPGRLGRCIFRAARHLPGWMTHLGRLLVRPLLRMLPRRLRPMPERMP